MNNETKLRTIKFRGKSTGDLGRWFYGYYHFDKHLNQHYICDAESLFRYEVAPETVGQFTGLLDDNRAEIYEGDIVYRIDSNETYTIEWNDDYCGWQYSNGESFQKAYGCSKVITGNIHE